MSAAVVEPEVAVTLPKRIYTQLSEQSRRLGIPLEWLVASLVADLMDRGMVAEGR